MKRNPNRTLKNHPENQSEELKCQSCRLCCLFNEFYLIYFH